MSNKKQIKIKQRDWNIVTSFKKEVNMKEKTFKDKKKYSRKVKHKLSQKYYLNIRKEDLGNISYFFVKI